ncbi:MFS transporter [Vibrio breoganii]|uniref:MFS transporter n=1 Tax=Vibrio breoganii TaxID=553239 RepID=UPI000C858155|nr:MFS transporter [Vibrio breoganii]PML93787.1 MFS transporter [Vibrio breoganii]PMN60845.1 MFS transporter [Vibrio breoganii]TKF86537.1 MFS transporter [Vibrio breoganii]
MKNSNMARYFQFALVILAAGAVFPLVYLKAQYQETILEVFQMSVTDLNDIYSILGLVFIAGYFPSGVLSDKFSAKGLLVVSLLGTAAGGFWFAQVPDFNGVIGCFVVWGIFAVLTFWSAHMKLTKMLSTPEEEGRFFGILDGGRGLVEAALGSAALALFTATLAGSSGIADKATALTSVIYMYVIALVVIAILVAIFVKTDDERVSDSKEEGFKLQDVSKILKNKFVYIHGLIIFCGYSVFWATYYYGGHLQTNLGFDAVAVGSTMVGVLWMRPLGGFFGGYLADKIGKAITVFIGLTGGCFSLLALALISSSAGSTTISALVLLTGFFAYIIRGTYWSLLGQAKISAALTGTAIGCVSLIGYFPDIFIPQMNSVLWSTYGNEGGYKAYFIATMVIGLIGAILALVFHKLAKAEEANTEKELLVKVETTTA